MDKQRLQKLAGINELKINNPSTKYWLDKPIYKKEREEFKKRFKEYYDEYKGGEDNAQDLIENDAGDILTRVLTNNEGEYEEDILEHFNIESEELEEYHKYAVKLAQQAISEN